MTKKTKPDPTRVLNAAVSYARAATLSTSEEAARRDLLDLGVNPVVVEAALQLVRAERRAKWTARHAVEAEAEKTTA